MTNDAVLTNDGTMANDAPTITVSNPVLRGMYPDPSWIWDEDGGRVALVNSSFELVPGLPIHDSRDLAHWRLVGHAVDEAMARRLLIPFVLDSGGLYAPTLRHIAGRYVICCTVARIDTDAAAAAGADAAMIDGARASQGNFIIEADALEGPWRGPYWVEGAEGIDPDLFEDIDGSVYWTQTRPAVHPRWEGQTEVWTQRIDPDGWRLMTSRDDDGIRGGTIIWNGYGVEAVWAEGPHLYRIGDYVYLMTAEGGTSFDHSEMIMRAAAPQGLRQAIDGFVRDARARGDEPRPPRPDERSVVGRYTRLFHPDKKNPFLTHRHLGVDERVQCVGHADLMRHPRFGWWLACLGSRQTRTGGHGTLSFLGRETFITPVDWQCDPAQWTLDAAPDLRDDGDPGWPVIAGGNGRLPETVQVDGMDGALRGVRVGRCEGRAVIDARAPFDMACDTACVRDEPSVVYRRLPEDRCVVRCPDHGSVHIRQDNGHTLRVDIDGDAVHWSLRRGEGADEGDIGAGGAHGSVMLVFEDGVVRIVVARSAPLAWDAPALAAIDVAPLSTEWSGGFVGCLVGVGATMTADDC